MLDVEKIKKKLLTDLDAMYCNASVSWGKIDEIIAEAFLPEWIPQDDDWVLKWDRGSEFATSGTWRKSSSGEWDVIIKCDERHLGKSTRVQDILKRKCIYYKGEK